MTIPLNSFSSANGKLILVSPVLIKLKSKNPPRNTIVLAATTLTIKSGKIKIIAKIINEKIIAQEYIR